MVGYMGPEVTGGPSGRGDAASQDCDSCSVCSEISSLYKERIDSLFRRTSNHNLYSDLEESSLLPSALPPPLPPPPSHSPPSSHVVQEQIQRLFQQAKANSAGLLPPAPPTSLQSRATTTTFDKALLSSSSEPSRLQVFPVRHLGSLPVQGKADTLDALQQPLRMLYFQSLAGGGTQGEGESLLEVLEEGLRIVSCASECFWFNPFPTIAVWAAVQLSVVREASSGPASAPPSSNGQDGCGDSGHHSLRAAFLPLVADPRSRDKASLFRPVGLTEARLLLAHPHPPLFACVMRRQGVSRLLECHAFACRSSHHALLLAASLYQALVQAAKAAAAMAIQIPLDSAYSTISPMPGSHPDRKEEPEPKEQIQAPVRPPRRKRSSSSSRTLTADIVATGTLQRSMSAEVLATSEEDQKPKMAGRPGDPVTECRGCIRRCESERQIDEQQQQIGGDIYTRVAFPRGHQGFMALAQRADLKELLEEMEHEGLGDVDSILRQVVRVEGMSFNELKPVHKALLLRVALTLSQDEMFRRSKSIMRQQQQQQQQPPNNAKSNGKSSSLLSLLEPPEGGLANVFRATKKGACILIKGKTKTLKDKTSEEQLAMMIPPPPPPPLILDEDHNNASPPSPWSPSESSTSSSTSSCANHQHHPNLLRPCGLNDESCATVEKCYCSLQRVKEDGLRVYRIDLGSSEEASEMSGGISDDSEASSSGWRWGGGEGGVGEEVAQGEGVGGGKILTTFKDLHQHAAAASPLRKDSVGQMVIQGASGIPSRRLSADRDNVLSVKKTAEIAALFTGIPLAQTTDILGLTAINNNNSKRRNGPALYSGSNIEISLGYLP